MRTYNLSLHNLQISESVFVVVRPKKVFECVHFYPFNAYLVIIFRFFGDFYFSHGRFLRQSAADQFFIVFIEPLKMVAVG